MKFTSLFISATALFSAAYGSTTDSDEDFNPVLTGTYDNGVLHWVLTSEVGSASEVDTTQDDTTDNYEWKDTSGTVYFDDTEAASTAYTVQNKNNKNYLYVPFAQSNSKLTYNFPDATASGDGPWTLSLKIYYIVSGDDMPTKEVTYTIEKPQPSKSSQSLSSSSSTQSSSSPVVSTGTPSTSTSSSTLSSSSISSNSEGSTTGNNVATTVITITSCADHICTKKPVTTGVTVCTATENGVETIYTTYCPLSGAAPEIATPATTPVPAPAAAPVTTLASVSQSQSYTPPAVATATGIAAAIEIKGAVFGAALVAFGALM